MKILNKVKPGPLALRIRHVRANVLKLSQSQFSNRVGVTQSAISKWERGALIPESQQLMKIAVLLEGTSESLYFLEVAGVPAGYLMGDSKYADKRLPAEMISVLNTTPEAMLSVPILRHGATSAVDAIERGEVDTFLPCLKKWMPRGASLAAVPVVGDAMVPLLCDGYIVVIDTAQRDPKKLVGRLVAVKNAEGIAIRWLRRDHGVYMLVPEHTSMLFPIALWKEEDEQVRIEGAVVQWVGFPSTVRKR